MTTPLSPSVPYATITQIPPSSLRAGLIRLLKEEGRCLPIYINEVKEGRILVTLHDFSRPIAQWERKEVKESEIEHIQFGQHTSCEGLITSLKKQGLLFSEEIEQAFRSTDRACFCAQNSYDDAPVDIACRMCISAPHMHIYALELLKKPLKNAKKVLDVGSGSGYLPAIFSKLAPKAQIFGVEYYEQLNQDAQRALNAHLDPEQQKRIHLITGNGEEGVAKEAPFDVIHVGFMCKELFQPLIDQLAPNGLLLIPVGNQPSPIHENLLHGELFVIEKTVTGALNQYKVLDCSFVPSQVEG